MTSWANIAPGIYLDSCVLLDAILGREEEEKDSDIAREAPIGKAIFQKWPREKLVVSPYVLGEFLELGKRRKKTEGEMNDIVDQEILRRCKVCFGVETDLTAMQAIYRKIGLESRMAFSMSSRGDATGPDGSALTDVEQQFIVLTNGDIMHGLSCGLPIDAEMPKADVTLTRRRVEELSAPILELALFHRVAQIVHEIEEPSRVPWKDAFHFYYAKKESCVYIATNDKGLLELRMNLPNGWPRPMRPSEIKKEVCSSYLAPSGLAREVFGPI